MSDWEQRDWIVFQAAGAPIPAYTCLAQPTTGPWIVRAAARERPAQTRAGDRCPIRPHLTAALAAAILMTVTAPRVETHAGCHSKRCVERVAMRACSQARPVPCIRRAAIHWRVSFPMLLRKARCESGLNPYARNASGSSGLFQFLLGTFYSARNPYRRHEIWSAKWSSLSAAYWHHMGWGGEWACR